MQEEGKLYQLKNKWWKEMYVEGSCDTEESGGSDSAAELGIGNVGGVFLVLGIGIFCSYCIAFVEFLWNIKTVAVEEKVTYTEALVAELKFALDVRTTTKPVHNCQTDSTSGGSSKSSKSSRRSSRSNSETKSFSTHLKHATSSALNIHKIGLLFNKDKNNGNVDKK
jgi:glutamate receptor, ionotropic, invertebrate